MEGGVVELLRELWWTPLLAGGLRASTFLRTLNIPNILPPPLLVGPAGLLPLAALAAFPNLGRLGFQVFQTLASLSCTCSCFSKDPNLGTCGKN